MWWSSRRSRPSSATRSRAPSGNSHASSTSSRTHFVAGWILYLNFITLVTHPLIFQVLEPTDWEGPYWICMGAAAITTLTGWNMLINLNMGAIYEATLVVTYLAWAIGA